MDALGLEWQQIVTNFIGFAAFLFLMAKFAWDPILGFMDKRREEIAGNFEKIEKEKSELESMKQEYRGHLDRIEEEATARINEAIKEGQESARHIEEEARMKAESIIEKARMDTERIVDQAKLDLKNYVVDVGVEAGRKATMKVMDEKAHRLLVEQMVEELSNV